MAIFQPKVQGGGNLIASRSIPPVSPAEQAGIVQGARGIGLELIHPRIKGIGMERYDPQIQEKPRKRKCPDILVGQNPAFEETRQIVRDLHPFHTTFRTKAYSFSWANGSAATA